MIDVHTHVIPPSLPEFPDDAGLQVRDRGKVKQVWQRDQLVREYDSQAWEPHARLAYMDLHSVDAHVLLPTPFTFLYDAPIEITSAVCQSQNEHIASMVQAAPDRFYGFGSVPLQDLDATFRELRRVQNDLQLHGVEIGTHLPDLDLGATELRPFFAEVERRGLPVFVHPYESRTPEQTDDLGLMFGLGYPHATMLSIGALGWGGVLDAHPDLRIAFAHGGGSCTGLLGRLAVGYERVPQGRGRTNRLPHDLMKSVWFDTLVYEPAVLRMMIDMVGAERLFVGTDFPFVAREEPPGAVVEGALSAGYISGVQAGRIRHDNARTFLGR